MKNKNITKENLKKYQEIKQYCFNSFKEHKYILCNNFINFEQYKIIVRITYFKKDGKFFNLELNLNNKFFKNLEYTDLNSLLNYIKNFSLVDFDNLIYL